MVDSPIRPRRTRISVAMGKPVCETALSTSDLVAPVFVRSGISELSPVASLPDHFQWPVDKVAREVWEIARLGI